jgi:hypothetical protein
MSYKEDSCFGRDQSKGYEILVGSRRIAIVLQRLVASVMSGQTQIVHVLAKLLSVTTHP